MKKLMRLIKAFGQNEAGWPDFPSKVSGTTVARVLVGDSNGCSRCFPHGYETINSSIGNRQRCWKRHRITQWRQ